MAIYHFGKVQILNRATGKGAVVTSAYISAEKIHNDYDNTTHDYTRKTGVVYKEIMLCDNAPKEWENRATLWNEVEKTEKAKDGQLARSFDVGLQREFSFEENKNLVREFVKNNYIDKGMCADVCIHEKGDGNPHAHIMLTMRKVDEGGKFSAKAEKEYLCRNKEGEEKYFKPKELKENNDFEKIYKCRYKNDYQNLTNTQLKSEEYKNYKKISKYPLDRKIDKCADWNNPNNVELWRKEWADINNKLFQEKGLNIRIDHRSYERQGIEKIATIHEGYSAREIEKKGGKSDRVEINREIKEQNNKLDEINKELKIDMQKLEELKREIERIEKLYKEKDINTLKDEKFKLQDKNKEIEKQLETIRKYRENQKEISKYEKLIEQEKEKKKGYSIFKRSERKNSDSMINRYENAIKGIKNDLIGALKSGNVTDEEIQKINNENLILKNQIEQLENEIKLREQQEKEIKEQLEKELKDIEESKKQRIPMEFREKDKEENEPKNNKNKIDEIKDVYIKLRKQEMEYPALKDDKEHQEKIRQAKELFEKYKPSYDERNNNKNTDRSNPTDPNNPTGPEF